MRVIEAKSTYLSSENLTPYQFIEKAGRTCYKSLEKITEDSAADFVQKLQKANHTAMLEHAHIYMQLSKETYERIATDLQELKYSAVIAADLIGPYLNLTHIVDNKGNYWYFMSGSFRTFIHMFDSDVCDYFYDVKYLYAVLHEAYPEVFPDESAKLSEDLIDVIVTKEEFQQCVFMLDLEKKIKDSILLKHMIHTVLFVCDRGVSHEFVRHRPCSFAQESTRYCDYSKNKHGKEITVIRPVFFKEGTENYDIWYKNCLTDEKAYFDLLANGCTAQQARDNLPTSVKTELIITATEAEWQHIINLRYHGTTGSPHPQMFQSMEQVYPELVKKSEFRLK